MVRQLCGSLGLKGLMYYVIVNLRLCIPWFGVVGLEWYPCCRLKHNWSVHVGAGG